MPVVAIVSKHEILKKWLAESDEISTKLKELHILIDEKRSVQANKLEQILRDEDLLPKGYDPGSWCIHYDDDNDAIVVHPETPKAEIIGLPPEIADMIRGFMSKGQDRPAKLKFPKLEL